MTNPFIARQDRPIGKTGRQAEKNLARRLGAGLTPASGAAGAKGDMVVGAWLVEAKSTTGDSLGVKYEWLAKISREAGLSGKTPALALTFVDTDGKPLSDGKWVCLREEDFREVYA